jgi:regulator of sigma E protease
MTDPATPEAKPQSWLAANAMPLLFVSALVGYILYRNLYVGDILLVALGLGLVIFLHELGHFLAAKMCDVHVKTFSIGFGKPLPFCSFQYGETTYKIGWIPLGGFVQMVGEGDNADSEEAEEDPRSFKNKKVSQRMFIISAGVIMNLILGVLCFIVAYSKGVYEPPGIIGGVSAGSPAWQAGIRPDTLVTNIGSIEKPTYPDIRVKVLSSSKGDKIPFGMIERDGTSREIEVEPRRDEGELFPTVGITQTAQLMLRKPKRPDGSRPARPYSPAANATGTDGSTLQLGDKIIASSHDPKNPTDVKPIPSDPRDPQGQKLDYFTYLEREHAMRGLPMIVRIERDGQTIDFTIAPDYTRTIPGARFTMGRIGAIRKDSPAANAKALEGGGETTGLLAAKSDVSDSGDKIIAVEFTDAAGKVRKFSSTQTEGNADETPLDPTRLPYELSRYAASVAEPKVKITVVRAAADASQKTPKRVTFELGWDKSYKQEFELVTMMNGPMPVAGLGLAFYVETTLDDVAAGSPAAQAGLQRSDVIKEIQFKFRNLKDETEKSEFTPLKGNQGAILFSQLQNIAEPEWTLKVLRPGDGDELKEITISIAGDPTWPAADRGFEYEQDTRLQKADGVWESLQFGGQRTVRMLRTIYQQLYSLISGRISAKTMSGPLSIANASYKIVGQDVWQFILFIGMISLNLAVVNFLPVPVLDGGHMVFLIYEKIFRRPPPDRVIEWSLYGGFGMILTLMVWVFYLDIKRLFF